MRSIRHSSRSCLPPPLLARTGSTFTLTATTYWVYPLAGGAHIERHVPALPLSRDLVRLAALRRSLVLYRMVFGQPQQEDLIKYLQKYLPWSEIPRAAASLRIDLSPPISLTQAGAYAS